MGNGSVLATGYVGTQSFLEQVHQLVLELKEKNKDIIFGECKNWNYFLMVYFTILVCCSVCDPVLGDTGELVSVPRPTYLLNSNIQRGRGPGTVLMSVPPTVCTQGVATSVQRQVIASC